MALPNSIRVMWSLVVVVLVAGQAQAGLVPVDPVQFFVAPDREGVLAWKAEPADTRVKTAFTIRNYEGRVVAKGEATVHDGRVEAPVKLAQGYYEIAFGDKGECFGICVLPERQGAGDAFFCSDSAWSWLEPRGEVRDALARMMRRVGVTCSRERLHWGEIQPEREKWDWQTKNRYEELRETNTRHGLPTLEMFHSAPRWMGATDENRYPADLVPAAEAWAKIAGHWRKHWAALELWNEPDIDFGSCLPGDQYVAVVKAVAYGLREVTPSVPVVGGVFTQICPDAYRRACALNGLLQEVDVISFHTYAKAGDMQKMVQTYRDWLKEAKAESMPLWITECGRPWAKGPARPPIDQDAESALDITMKGVEARACGVAAYYPFINVYFEENTNNFGMLGREVTPLRSMGAYAHMITALAHRAYRGDIATTDPAIQRARVFGDDERAVVVVYTGAAKSGATVRIDVPIERLEGIDGRALAVTGDGLVPVPDGITYVWVKGAKLGTALRKDTDAAKLYALSLQSPPRRSKPSPIILQHRFDPKQMKAEPTGYSVSPEVAKRFALHVRVQNLGERAEHVALSISAAGPAGQANGGLERTANVAARGTADVVWELDLKDFADARGACTLVVNGKADSGERVSPLAVDVRLASDAAQPGK